MYGKDPNTFLQIDQELLPLEPNRSVDWRAAGPTAEYERKTKKCDMEYCGTVPGQVGPALAKLQSFGEVGSDLASGERLVSREIHNLIHQMAGARLVLPGMVKPVGKKLKKWRTRLSLLSL